MTRINCVPVQELAPWLVPHAGGTGHQPSAHR